MTLAGGVVSVAVVLARPPVWPPTTSDGLTWETWSPPADWPGPPEGWVFYRGPCGEVESAPPGCGDPTNQPSGARPIPLEETSEFPHVEHVGHELAPVDPSPKSSTEFYRSPLPESKCMPLPEIAEAGTESTTKVPPLTGTHTENAKRAQMSLLKEIPTNNSATPANRRGDHFPSASPAESLAQSLSYISVLESQLVLAQFADEVAIPESFSTRLSQLRGLDGTQQSTYDTKAGELQVTYSYDGLNGVFVQIERIA